MLATGVSITSQEGPFPTAEVSCWSSPSWARAESATRQPCATRTVFGRFVEISVAFVLEQALQDDGGDWRPGFPDRSRCFCEGAFRFSIAATVVVIVVVGDTPHAERVSDQRFSS